MRRFHPPYPSEFRSQVVGLVRAGRSIASLVKEFNLTDTTIRNWLRQTDLDAGKRTDGLTTEEKQELTRLRRENARLREERDILEKATAWFAREAGTRGKKRSDS